ncbi:MAG: peptide-N-glycosidase F-related protein [Bacteroidota bacterium]
MGIKNSVTACLLGLFLVGCREEVTEKRIQQVVSHDDMTIVCDPSRGNNPFVEWAIFPSDSVPVRRIFMNVRLGHPDSINIAHWDYLDPITIKRTGGIHGDTLDLELGKMLTPYGSNFKKDWDWNWRIDVTDFAPVLRDSVEIEYNHSGYEATTVGWNLDVWFNLELGDLVAKPLGYQELYHGAYAYGNPEKPINETLTPIEVPVDPGAAFGRLRILHTGHGMDRPKGCSEFCSRWREVLLDGKTIDHRDMWKECADNNLYPQGGTWIFDRAYWCPGDLQHPDLIDFPIGKTTHTIDLEMEPYTATDNIQANESLSAIVFQYEKPAKQFDVSLERILVPNDALELNRLNPAHYEPLITIKNLGSQPLTSLTIKYGSLGFGEKTFQWTGELDFYQEAQVILPGNIDFNFGENTFFARLEKPNGETDEWQSDNVLETTFQSVKEMPQEIVVTYKTNNNPEENIVQIATPGGKMVYDKNSGNTEKDKLYRDTLHLDMGRYCMVLQDSTHNGLEFWFMPQQGFGYLQLSDVTGRVLHRFESDSGVGEQLDFIVKEFPNIDIDVEQSLLKLHPRRVRDTTRLFIQLEKRGDAEVHILKDGELQKKIPFPQIKDETLAIDLSEFKDGRYVIEFFVDGESKLKQRISKRAPRNNP